ncbi:hypothetical protein [Okeania sp. KiyG1]|uniref:hypothetical protein n=1 Tax=Okeania sp. KiyG1 TaxID=2720165 RepID=UPI0019244590|nr:hypothetical protein [Okeania sp. KiyG1]GGA21948.1 hypothetical protein CYANOKiyG1_37010 [Okeania sp. KiyG1]
MTITQIKVTKADNELFLIASTARGSSELLHYKSGGNKPVDVTIYPSVILAPGTYSLTMVGVNWGGPSAYEVIVTEDDTDTPYSGGSSSGSVGVDWTQTISINI